MIMIVLNTVKANIAEHIAILRGYNHLMLVVSEVLFLAKLLTLSSTIDKVSNEYIL